MKTFAVIGAMPSELKDLREMLGEPEIRHIAAFDFYINQYKENRIINVCCGVGKVNSAVCTQLLIDSFKVDCIINAGVAGGMNRDVKVFDIVISTEVLHHDLDPQFVTDYPPYCGIFKADESLVEKAAAVCEEYGVNCFRQRIVSGEAFVSDSALKAAIQEKFEPYAVDMESAAVGHACYLNNIPFVSIRCISDNADDDGMMSFQEFQAIAAKRVADIVLSITEK